MAGEHVEATPEREFAQQWADAEEMPACDAGMVLLRQFAEASPTLFEWVMQRGFTDPTHPAFARNARWKAFATHRSTCEKCNEV
jgi:hypothetical protein